MIRKTLFILAVSAFMPAMADVGADDIGIRSYGFKGNAFPTGVSQNGKYAVYSAYREDNSLYDFFGKLVEVDSGRVIDLAGNKTPEVCGANDVSNDGLVVGCYGEGALRSNPAFWTETRGWILLPYPDGQWEGGIVNSVTDDGRYCVGKVYKQDMMWEEPVLWSLGDEPKVIETPGVPYTNTQGVNEHQTRFTDISDNGRYITGVVSFSYEHGWNFIYDRETREVKSSDARFSTNGRWIYGRWSRTDDTGVKTTGYYRYDTTTGECEYEEAEEFDGMLSAMDDEGHLYGSGPGYQPVRNWSVLCDGYWIPFDKILRQVYGTDMSNLTGYDEADTGTIMGISGDGRTIGSLIYYQAGEEYLIRLPESPYDSARKVDFFADYAVTPPAGAHVSSLRDFRVTFDRSIDVKGTADCAVLADGEGNEIARSVKVEKSRLNDKTVEISFRKQHLDPDKEYILKIAAGTVSLAGDDSRSNREINIGYSGREARPVEMTSAAPASGLAISGFSMSRNPIVLTFDTDVLVADGAAATFELVEDDGLATELCAVGMMAAGNKVLLYPYADQNLFKDNAYRVTMKKGSLTDVVGENSNEEIVLYYTGSYEQAFNADDIYLFRNNFDDGSWATAFMFYEGDHNEPSQQMKGWNFLDGDSYPWWWVRDSNESSDYALASHSMYSPAGRSDDWCMLPRLYIPDDKCELHFKCQSYLQGKDDVLTLWLWESDVMLSSLNDRFMARIKDEGTSIAEIKCSPGASEELLEGEWQEQAIDLSAYAGKNIYLAFVNRNNDCSALFIDDVAVVRNLNFVISLDHDPTVAEALEAEIKGRVRVESDNRYTGLALRLIDGVGKEVDRIEATGLDLGYSDIYDFEFARRLPLKPGRRNAFTVTVEADGVEVSSKGEIANLYFTPEKRVVIEEGTGQLCQNCPYGHIMLERLADAYGDKVIPLALHTYTGDPLGSGLAGYAEFLNITAYPSAVVNRSTSPIFPMKTEGGRYLFSDPENPLWWDAVASCMQGYALAAVSHMSSAGATQNPEYDGTTLWIPVGICYALDSENVNDHVLSVLVEDSVPGYQVNGLYNQEDPLLGEWGKGGSYGQMTVTDFLFNDVVRGVCGTTYNGTAGLLPINVKGGTTYAFTTGMPLPGTVRNVDNCKVVTMLIDGNSGEVVNAVSSRVVRGSGVTAMELPAEIRAEGRTIIVETNSEQPVAVYGIDGRLLYCGLCTGRLTIDCGPGLHIVRAGSSTAKLRLP